MDFFVVEYSELMFEMLQFSYDGLMECFVSLWESFFVVGVVENVGMVCGYGV